MSRAFPLIAAAAVVAAAPAAYARPAMNASPAMNAINVIAPYKLHGMWVFDDALGTRPRVTKGCSALLRYFDQAPPELYAQVKPIPGKSG